jgi:hypothetical protein
MRKKRPKTLKSGVDALHATPLVRVCDFASDATFLVDGSAAVVAAVNNKPNPNYEFWAKAGILKKLRGGSNYSYQYEAWPAYCVYMLDEL